VRRPKLDYESTTLGLDRMELGAFLAQAAASTPTDHALACLLGLLGLRVSEACAVDVEHLSLQRGHRTLTVIGKGGKSAIIPLPPRVARAVDLAADQRLTGPVLLSRSGRRLDRHGAARIVRRVARRAGITKRISSHSLRHSFITAALDAGVPLRDVQVQTRRTDESRIVRLSWSALCGCLGACPSSREVGIECCTGVLHRPPPATPAKEVRVTLSYMEPDPRTAIAFEWDSKNVDKLAKRQIRPEDVEAVFTNRPRRFLRNKRSSTARYLMIGIDDSGRPLTIGVLWADEPERVLRAVTGWPS
jgi:uncharacterized DUF497 family protein